MTEDIFDLTTTTADEVERGGTLPPGWYLACVSDLEEDGLTHALKFTFTVAAGPYRGAFVTDTLWHPANATDEKKRKITQNRRVLFASRLGLLAASDFGKAGVRVKWTDAIGKRVWLSVDNREYDKRDQHGRPTGQKGVASNLKFDGIYPVDSDKVPADIRNGQGAAGWPAAAAAPARRDFADL